MYDAIKETLATAVPFAATVGVSIDSVGPGEAFAKLVQRDGVSNHIGSMHAGALFTLGETASGAAMSGAFAPQLALVRPIATSASIAYRRIARGEVVAQATVTTPVNALCASLDANGKVAFDVDVTMSDATGATVATMTVGWLVSKRAPPA